MRRLTVDTRQLVTLAVLCAFCASGCAAALEPRTVSFAYGAPELRLPTRIRSYDEASAVIAAVFERDLGFRPFTATLRLYPDRLSFETALTSAGYDPPFARETAQVMAAVGGHRGVLLNEQTLAAMSWFTRVGLLAHELTHTLQYELAGGRRGTSDQWLREGFAEWVAMRVVDRLGAASAADFRRDRLRQLRATRAASAPKLAEMVTFRQLVALAARDDIAPYAQAFLAVDLLINRHGLAAMLRYFELFATSRDRLGNFTTAFGETLPSFESALREHLWPRRGPKPSAPGGLP
jgi:hypothetical protein